MSDSASEAEDSVDLDGETGSENDESLLSGEDQALESDASSTSEDTQVSEPNGVEESQDGTASESDASVISQEALASEPVEHLELQNHPLFEVRGLRIFQNRAEMPRIENFLIKTGRANVDQVLAPLHECLGHKNVSGTLVSGTLVRASRRDCLTNKPFGRIHIISPEDSATHLPQPVVLVELDQQNWAHLDRPTDVYETIHRGFLWFANFAKYFSEANSTSGGLKCELSFSGQKLFEFV